MITVEELHEAWVKQFVRASQAEQKVKELESELKVLKEKQKDG
jgi:hypothetical protein